MSIKLAGLFSFSYFELNENQGMRHNLASFLSQLKNLHPKEFQKLIKQVIDKIY